MSAPDAEYNQREERSLQTNRTRYLEDSGRTPGLQTINRPGWEDSLIFPNNL